MDSLYVAMVLAIAILIASMVSVELVLSVSIIEIILGVALGNALGLNAPEWLVFLAGVGAILLTTNHVLNSDTTAPLPGVRTRLIL